MSRKTFTERLHHTIVYIFYFLFLTTPLIWVEANSELFEVPKMVFIYFMASVLFSLWLAKQVASNKFTVKRHWFNYIVLIFLASQVVSTIFSVHPYTSVFGYYSRLHGGLLSTIAYSVLYFVFINTFRQKEALKAVGVLVSSVIITSLIAFPEHFNLAFSCLVITGNIEASCWVQDIVTRVFGTFGQPNWLAAYIITLMPLLWAKIFTRKQIFSWTTLLLTVGNGVAFSSLLFTKSKSGFLGFVVSLLIFFLGVFIIKLRNSDKQKTHSPFLTQSFFVLAAMLIPLLVFGSEYTPSLSKLASRFTTSEEVPAAKPTVDTTIPLIERGGTDSGEIRRIVWSGAWKMFLANPLFGTGVETFAYSYYNYRPVEHNLISEWDFLYNKAHNEFINYAATTGAFGLISYLGLIAGFSVIALQGLFFSKKQSKKSAVNQTDYRWVYTGLLSGMAALAVSNFFGFSTVSVGVLFFVIPAIAVVLKTDDSKLIEDKTNISSQSYLGLVGVLALALTMTVLVGRYYIADIVFASGTSAESNNDLTTAIQHYQTAIELSRNQARFYNSYADALSKAAYAFALDQNEDATERFARQAFTASAKTLELNPVHINYYKNQAGVFIRLAPINPELLSISEQILETATKLAPTDAKITYNLALIKIDQEATSSAQEYLERTVNLKANYESARMELAKIYEQNGEYEKASEQYTYILTYIAPENTLAKEGLERVEQAVLEP